MLILLIHICRAKRTFIMKNLRGKYSARKLELVVGMDSALDRVDDDPRAEGVLMSMHAGSFWSVVT